MPNGVSKFRDVFFEGIEESFVSTYRCDEDSDVIHVNDRDDYDKLIKRKFDFKDFLEDHLVREKKLSKNFIKSRASKTLSQPSFDNTFFNYIENTLIELNKKSNTIGYLSINKTVIDIMEFYDSKYSRYHNFSKDYLDTLSIYRKITKSEKVTLSFNWREENKYKEIEYLYNSLIKARPPFINSSLGTFNKAFTYKKLEDDETIKWLCI